MTQQLIIAGDLNYHIGANADGFSSVHRGFGYGVRNDEGRTILEFATTHDLEVVNSFFKKRDAHPITFHNGDHDTQIDYMLVRKGDLRLCKDCKVFPGEGVTPEEKMETVAGRKANVEYTGKHDHIKEAAKEILGVVAGTSRTHIGRKESWCLRKRF
ncbi:craniofacial development protein 2-like protein [Tanacetum coccineum]